MLGLKPGCLVTSAARLKPWPSTNKLRIAPRPARLNSSAILPIDSQRAGFRACDYKGSIRRLDHREIPGHSRHEIHVAPRRRRSASVAQAMGEATPAGADAFGRLRQEHGDQLVFA